MANKKRARTSSVGENRAKRRPAVNSQADFDENSQNDMLDDNAADDVVKDEPYDLLRHRVLELESVTERQKGQIQQLQIQLEFLMTLLGISESHTSSEKSSSAVPPATIGAWSSSLRPAGAVPVNSVPSAADTVSAISKFRTTVAVAVHTENRSIQNRSRNIVISGLPEISGVSEREAVVELLNAELGLRPVVGLCKRLGKPSEGRARKLLVTVGTAEQVAQVLASAKQLRLSSVDEIRNQVYINADQTRAEATAAYEQRCRRRATNNSRRAATTAIADVNMPTTVAASGDQFSSSPTVLPLRACHLASWSQPSSQPSLPVGTALPTGPSAADRDNIEHTINCLLDAARGRSPSITGLGSSTPALRPDAPTFVLDPNQYPHLSAVNGIDK